MPADLIPGIFADVGEGLDACKTGQIYGEIVTVCVYFIAGCALNSAACYLFGKIQV